MRGRMLVEAGLSMVLYIDFLCSQTPQPTIFRVITTYTQASTTWQGFNLIFTINKDENRTFLIKINCFYTNNVMLHPVTILKNNCFATLQ